MHAIIRSESLRTKNGAVSAPSAETTPRGGAPTGVGSICELLAVSARRPAAVTFSLEEFSRHGGVSGPHQDGCGIAFHQDRAARIIRETLPAASSACERCLELEPIQNSLALSQIRRATQGEVALENTHPFTRELGGRRHVFAHNGNLDQDGLSRFPLGRFRMLDLHILCRHCTDEPGANIDIRGFHVTSSPSSEQSVVLIASVPLTKESREPLGEDEILTVARGRLLSRTALRAEALLEGAGT